MTVTEASFLKTKTNKNITQKKKKKKKVLLQKKDCWLMPGKLTEWSSRVALRTGENQDRFQLARATITEYHRPDGLNN